MSKRKKVLIALFLVFLIFPVYNIAAKGALSPDAQMCIGCHSNKDFTKQLENKETLSLYVNGDEFANSVHNPTSCAGCHTDISMANHPRVKKINSKKEYSANASKVCSMCHPNEMLKKKPMHGYVITQTKAPLCADCHGAHYIKRIAEWKTRISDNQYCLTCHKYALGMKLSSGESLSLSVNESLLKSSVHGNFPCSVCHTGFSKTDHPVRTFKNKKEFTANASKTCTMCHTETQLKKKPIHGEIIASKVTTCIECHGSHSIKRMSELKPLVKENQHCLTCHKHKLSMSLKSGESLSLSVDESVIRKSVHNKLQCSACHIGFSKTEHPKRVFESKRNYSLSASEVCKKCHENANKLYEESIHLAQLKSGNLKSSTCTDCHGSHSMIKVTTDKMLGLLSCNKCHGEINNAYKTSAHGEALTKAKENAPTCSSCHNAHDIKVTARTTKMKDTCLKCHKDAEALHKKWLSNPPITLSSFAALHFDVITCTTCHAVPNAGRGIYLSLYDKKTGKPFPEEEVLKLLGTDSSGLVKKIDTNGDGGIDARELWNITQQLNGKGANVTFIGRMDVQKGAEAHQIAAKTKAVKDCEQCHRADSSYFKNVSIVLFKADGRPTLYTAQQGVLKSLFSVLPVNQFYALGSSNIKLLDILFILAVGGGLCVPIGHITLRIVTKPLRHLRKMGKGGKK